MTVVRRPLIVLLLCMLAMALDLAAQPAFAMPEGQHVCMHQDCGCDAGQPAGACLAYCAGSVCLPGVLPAFAPVEPAPAPEPHALLAVRECLSPPDKAPPKR